VRTLAGIFGERNVRVDDQDRYLHGFGKGYLDLIRVWKGSQASVPDVVVYPANESEISRLFSESENSEFVVIPYGGATTVTGGVDARTEDAKIVICLDLKRMNQVLTIDEKSLLAEVQPGCLGPDLERTIGSAGLTLGHFPQSFEFSSVGGWVATRGAGYESTRYGKIEDMVESIRLATPQGIIETPRVPASAAGADLKQVLVGSEGSIGIITSVTLRLRKAAATSNYSGIIFRNFQDALEAIRTMIQEDIVPNVIRLSDPSETEASMALAARDDEPLLERVGLWFLRKRGTSTPTAP